MKKLILLELTLLFLATTFSSNPPPGWYQQALPVNDFVNDIFFLDSLNGWIATNSNGSSNDTAYIMKTSDGGNNWSIQERSRYYYTRVQFLDLNNGYLCGSTGAALVWKTTNGGNNWYEVHNFGLAFAIEDIDFINLDTGWASSSDFMFGGVWKTTDGGSSWVRQINPSPSVQIKSIFFLNSDTGWAISSDIQSNLYRTTNGGMNWNVQHTFTSQTNDIFFFNQNIGIISGAFNYRTTDGGFNWIQSNHGGIKLSFPDDSIGWAGSNFNKISKTTNGGFEWFKQSSPLFDNSSIAMLDSLKGFAGGTGLVRTATGGITLIENNTNVLLEFTLYQNYPNPFNPKTVISYELRVTSYVEINVYDVQGKGIKKLISQRQNTGEYNVEFDGSELNSGVYFYKIVVDSLGEISDEKNNKIYSETKKMLLIK